MHTRGVALGPGWRAGSSAGMPTKGAVMAMARGAAVGTGPAGARLAASEWAGYLETVSLVCCGMPPRVRALDAAAGEPCGARPAGMPLRELRLDADQDMR